MDWLGGLLREQAEEDATAFDADRLWGKLQPELPAPPSVWDRIAAWLTPARLLPAGGLIAATAAVLIMLLPAPVGDGGDELEAEVVSNECVVDSVEAGPDHTVVVAQTAGAEGATVIWLLPADDGGLLP